MSDPRNTGAWPPPAQQPSYGNYPGNPAQPYAAAPVYGGTYPASGPYGPGPEQVPPSQRRNGFGIAALVLGIVSLVGAFIPVINYGSGVLAFIGLVLGIVGICLKNRARGMAITGSILSLVAIVTSIALAITYTSAFIDTLSDLPTTKHTTDAAEEPGTFDNPLSLGTAATLGAADQQWEVSVDEVLVYSDEEDYQTTSYGAEPSAGDRYISIELTVMYLGDGSATPSTDLSVAFVDQNAVEYSPGYANPPGPNTPFDEIGPVYTNESVVSSVVIEVPEDVLSTGLVHVRLGNTDSCYFRVS